MTSAIRLKADKFTDLRTQRGLTSDRALADKAGVNHTTVYRLINGHSQPGHKIISGLCAALDAEFDDLFEVVDAA